MTRHTIVPLGEERIVSAARALAEAFHDDPLQAYVFPDAAEPAATGRGI